MRTLLLPLVGSYVTGLGWLIDHLGLSYFEQDDDHYREPNMNDGLLTSIV